MRLLDPSIKTVWTIKHGVLGALVAASALTYEVVRLFGGEAGLPFGVLTGGAVLLGLAYALAVPRLRYRSWRFDLRPEELYLERGIFNRVRTIVPLRRIQHLDVSQDLLERAFALGKLIVHTAGTRNTDVMLPGLRIEEAERLRDEVRHAIAQDAG